LINPHDPSNRWRGLEFRHLTAFEAVARAGSFARAADELEYTQPAVSQQVAALERAVGQRLFDRRTGPRRVELTEAGELLLGHVRAIQGRFSAARADMEAYAAGRGGRLRVGTFQSTSARILPELVRKFAAAWPLVHVELTERSDDQDLLELVDRGHLDVTFAMLPLAQGPFDHTELLRDPYVLVIPRDGTIEANIAELDDLGRIPLIAYRNCRSSPLAEGYLRSQGIEPQVVFRSDDNSAVQALVRAGLGAALSPRLAVDLDDPGVEVLELDGLIPPRLLALVWSRNRYRSPAQEAFTELARELSSAPAGDGITA
jgi:DNA-binding transcriptional LysR family regulator